MIAVGWRGLAALLTLAILSPAAAGEPDDAPEWDFVVGRYWLVGRYPDSAASYGGSAQIERIGGRLSLSRTIAGRQTRVYGIVRRADPGEARVLAFRWGESRPREMVCLIGGDLDNYPRLTCNWGLVGNPHRQPGMEAYFSVEPWRPVTALGSR